ncbi:MAG: hypothetical protein CMJ59_14940 [Planctomycetaceae bacterium]|nr:hypothetical protein [Planctomycetaceae bacterium]
MESVVSRAESARLGDQYDDDVVAPECEIEAWTRAREPTCIGARLWSRFLPDSALINNER